MSDGKPLFSWKAFDRDAGFADQAGRQPLAPRRVLVINMGETIGGLLHVEAAYQLVWSEFRTGTAKLKDIHFFIRLACNDISWIAGMKCVLYL